MEAFSRINLGVPLNETDKIRAFATGEEMERFYVANVDDVWAGVEFSFITNADLSSTTQYAIRIDFHDLPDTEDLSDNDNGLEGNKDYVNTGFLSLQTGIDSVLLLLQTDQVRTSPSQFVIFLFHIIYNKT
jgi:hypothetical protein